MRIISVLEAEGNDLGKEKKMRSIKRKTKIPINCLTEATAEFPSELIGF